MEALLARKPLTQTELAASPSTVCVTGAAGYIGSAIVCRLLAAGHTVHATYRDTDDAATLEALRALPEGSSRVKWFQADLLHEGAFDEAVRGCKYVIHTAANVCMNCPPSAALPYVVAPAVRGTHSVLGAASRAGGVERVVMTSSIAAVLGGVHHAELSHMATEDDWCLSSTPQLAYAMAKTLSEWEAWAVNAQQDRWSLVTINPAVVLGPPLAANRTSESVTSIKKLMDGSYWPFVPPLDMPTVDIADVAAAHCIAMLDPAARGRYIICERSALLTEMSDILHQAFPAHWVPHIPAPFWLAAIVFKLTGALSMSWLREGYGRRTLLSSAKALRELKGLGPLIPLERSLVDMGQALIRLGLLPEKRGKGAGGASSKGGDALRKEERRLAGAW